MLRKAIITAAALVLAAIRGNFVNATAPGQIGVFRSSSIKEHIRFGNRVVATELSGTNPQWIVDSLGLNSFNSGDKVYTFGSPGDLPVVGDWDGTGVLRIGVFRQRGTLEAQWYLDINNNGQLDLNAGDTMWHFGLTGDQPVYRPTNCLQNPNCQSCRRSRIRNHRRIPQWLLVL